MSPIDADSDCPEPAESRNFEMLLAMISAQFINLPAEQVDVEIEKAQRRVCECLGFDVSALWQWDPDDPQNLILTHYHLPPGGAPVPNQMHAAESFPWSLREVMGGRRVVISSIDNAPEEAARDKEIWRHYGIKSNLTLPLSAGGAAPFGALSFNDMAASRVWPDELIHRLELVALVFSNAIVRKRFEEALQESEMRVALATEAAGAAPWVLNIREACFWVGGQIMEFFGLPSGNRLALAAFLDLVHPDDRPAIRRTIEAALLSRELTVVEYRIVRPDGRVRWMISRGRTYTKKAGDEARFMGITSDITSRKENDKALRESESRMAAALDVAELGFYELLNGVRVTFLDRRTCEILGLSEADEKAGQILEFWGEHIHPEDRPRIMEVRRAMEESGRDRMMVDYRFLNPQRGVLHIHHLSHVMERDAAGRAVRTIGVLRDITEQKALEFDLRKALDDVRQLRDQLHRENVYLREQMFSESGHGAIIGESEPIKRMLALAMKVAPTDSAVLITGETGTGKELLAQAIHDFSSRKQKIMVKVNCAALPAPLIESELFGREKGAYTGAMTQQVGRFEVANGSTIFLDEIGDLPLDLQTKLLRVLQDGLYERLGSHRTLKADVRVIAATNRDLSTMIREGKFREDLFHRLNVFPIEVPALRLRGDDIPLLVWKFVEDFNTKMGRSIEVISKPAMEQLKQYAWPGNVRELRNVIERAMIVSEGRSLKIELPEAEQNMVVTPATLEAVERKHILGVLEVTHWRISGKGGAAEILGLLPTTLHSRLKKLGLARPSR